MVNGRYFALQRKFQSLPIGERCPSNPLFNDQDRYFRIHGNFGADAAEDKFCNSVHAAAADEDHASFGFFGGGQDLLRGVANLSFIMNGNFGGSCLFFFCFH